MAKDLSRVVPKPASGKPQPKDPNAGTWRDPSQYDPAYLSQVGGQALVDVYEGLSQLPGTMYNVLRGFMERQRQKSPEELRGTADPYDTATYDAAMAAIEGAAREPVKTAKSAASALAEYGKKAVSGPAGMTQFLAENLTPLPRTTRGPGKMGVVKPKGGDFPKTLEAVKKLEIFEPDVRGRTNENTLNNWLNTKLDRYIRTEMATPEDPIRKLAEQGILHVAPEQINYNLRNYGLPQFAHPNETLLAKSDTAKIWEGAADNQMGHMPVKSLVQHYDDFSEYRKLIDENPGLYDVAEKDPNRPLYFPSEEIGTNLGFEHLRDELYNSLRTDSNLPQQLRMTPEQLGRMSVPDAVRHVSKINKWREKQKAEANFALANNAATVPFKDYPDQKYAWYQLKAKGPDEISAYDFETIGEAAAVEQSQKALADALRYEGEVMGHCVGGYCDDVIAGRSAIYSLRNKKTGEPHVTIEVEPPANNLAKVKQEIDTRYPDLDENEKMRMLRDAGWVDEEGIPYPNDPRILQIKGKANRKPKDEYIPFVQDFVKSQRWYKVGDLDNADLIHIDPDSDVAQFLKASEMPIPTYVTNQELTDILNNMGRKDTVRSRLKSTIRW